jgi:hypothetical protein
VSVLPKLRRQDVWERHRLHREADSERVGRLPPEAKVNMAIDMTDAIVRVCLEGLRAQNPNMTTEEYMKKLRERFEWAKRWQKRGGLVE